MKNSYLTAGIRFRPLIRLLSRNPVGWTPETISRVLFLLQSSLWSSLFSRIEAITYREALRNTPVPPDPIFIIGHWRTGSTLLHQLMAQDPELVAPTLFQVALPENFFVSYRFYQPIFRMLMGSTRPMDNVSIGMDEPQEDEYAIFRLTTQSPLEQLIFPSSRSYFLTRAPFLPEDDFLDQWGSSLQHFYRKLHLASGKRIISKNPFNSFRIPLLVKLFPQAKFIHITRHPYAVVPSTRHLWEIVQKQNVLNNKGYIPTVEEVSSFFSRMSETITAELLLLSREKFAEIRYEDLEQNPVSVLRLLYRKLQLPFTDRFEDQLNAFVKSIEGYQKNVFSLSDLQKKVIATNMRNYMACYGYGENA
ncbi:MAG: sulfotransferase [Bacteroidales bacterium]|nr:sulfotransferase [Bacteroidales bacterium]